MIQKVRAGHPGVVDVSFPQIEKFDQIPAAKESACTAFVSIMEGCSKYCTFCVVPYTRGEEISRPLDDVIAEIAGLADLGVKEVNLLGQNVNAYRGTAPDSSIWDLAELIPSVAEINGIDLLDPMPYIDFMNIVTGAALAITDSGGLQEETTYLGIPCLTMRENTERPITVTQGTNKLVSHQELLHCVRKILAGEWSKGSCPPLWDGKAASRAALSLEKRLSHPDAFSRAPAS